MADTGWKSPSSTIDKGSSWTNVNNLKANDGNYAIANTLMGDSTSYVFCTGFGFNIPKYATINDIKCRIKGYSVPHGGTVGNQGASGTYWIKDGVSVGTGTTSYIYSTDQYYDVKNGLAGVSWSYLDINNSTFGAKIHRGSHSGTATDVDWYLDHIEMIVYYTESPPIIGEKYPLPPFRRSV
jgi:hypothetical protein